MSLTHSAPIHQSDHQPEGHGFSQATKTHQNKQGCEHQLAPFLIYHLGGTDTYSLYTYSHHSPEHGRMGSKVRSSFGDNTRNRRLAAGLSQEELAAKAGLHRTYIGGIERGERNISLENIVRLAKALKTSPSSLFEGIGHE